MLSYRHGKVKQRYIISTGQQPNIRQSERDNIRHVSCSGKAIMWAGIRVVDMYEECSVPCNDVQKHEARL